MSEGSDKKSERSRWYSPSVSESRGEHVLRDMVEGGDRRGEPLRRRSQDAARSSGASGNRGLEDMSERSDKGHGFALRRALDGGERPEGARDAGLKDMSEVRGEA
ncbi:hypothetical protein [Nannocystis pusilla]|uniref:hypothetical protein n=1 Tax=Nannocystis pusilla TaxID=889268 RepID=UPI003DA55B9D